MLTNQCHEHKKNYHLLHHWDIVRGNRFWLNLCVSIMNDISFVPFRQNPVGGMILHLYLMLQMESGAL